MIRILSTYIYDGSNVWSTAYGRRGRRVNNLMQMFNLNEAIAHWLSIGYGKQCALVRSRIESRKL